MYGLMVDLEPTRATPVSRGRNEGLNFRNVVAESETTGDGNHGSSGGIGRNLECWNCGGDHLNRNCPICAEEKEKNKRDDGGANSKCTEVTGANGKRAEVTGGKLHTMITSSVDVPSEVEFSEMGLGRQIYLESVSCQGLVSIRL